MKQVFSGYPVLNAPGYHESTNQR